MLTEMLPFARIETQAYETQVCNLLPIICVICCQYVEQNYIILSPPCCGNQAKLVHPVNEYAAKLIRYEVGR